MAIIFQKYHSKISYQKHFKKLALINTILGRIAAGIHCLEEQLDVEVKSGADSDEFSLTFQEESVLISIRKEQVC